MEERSVNIKEVIYSVKKKSKIIIIFTLLCTLLATVIATFILKPTYEAKVKIFAGSNDTESGEYRLSEVSSYKELIGFYTEIIKTEDFMQTVITRAQLNLSPEQVLNALSFTTVDDAPVLTIKYVGSNRDNVEKIVSTLSKEFESGVKAIIPDTYTKVIDSVKVTERVPAKSKVIIVGFFVGLFFAIGFALILDYLDDTITRREDLDKIIKSPVLCELPVEQS